MRNERSDVKRVAWTEYSAMRRMSITPVKEYGIWTQLVSVFVQSHLEKERRFKFRTQNVHFQSLRVWRNARTCQFFQSVCRVNIVWQQPSSDVLTTIDYDAVFRIRHRWRQFAR